MENIIPQNFHIDKEERNKLNGHNSFVVWFTGLSGSGKSTLANLVEKKLFETGIKTFSLDGDNIRSGLNKDLRFSADDRKENLRRIAEVAKLFIESGTVVIASFISPLKKDREYLKKTIGRQNFIEVFVNTSLDECERRDVKGLYKKARAGEIKNFTGIDAPYEKPENPDLEIKTEEENLEDALKRIVLHLEDKLKISVT
ncbi:adenylylsulfate kinase [Salegentibacter salinarum]|nr:adenylyl-sulfate kinase [Salegentibacter salinarum]SKB59857.1 adenylylsulfate kinase [Salegentibacter salinarum]